MNLVRQCNRLAKEAASPSSAGDVQVWMVFDQPDLVEGVPAHGKGVELGDLCGPFQPLAFYDSIKFNAK